MDEFSAPRDVGFRGKMFNGSGEEFQIFLGAWDIDRAGKGNGFAVVLRFRRNECLAVLRNEGPPTTQASGPFFVWRRGPSWKSSASSLYGGLDISCV